MFSAVAAKFPNPTPWFPNKMIFCPFHSTLFDFDKSNLLRICFIFFFFNDKMELWAISFIGAMVLKEEDARSMEFLNNLNQVRS